MLQPIVVDGDGLLFARSARGRSHLDAVVNSTAHQSPICVTYSPQTTIAVNRP